MIGILLGVLVLIAVETSLAFPDLVGPGAFDIGDDSPDFGIG